MKKNNLFYYLSMIAFMFIFSGGLYYTCELIYRQYSHPSMFILAGILGVLIGFLNDTIFSYKTDFLIQVAAATLLCVIGEGITGIIVNKMMGLNIWDYSHSFGNFFFGQCNLFFTFAWALISGMGIFILDHIEYKLFDFGDEEPNYHIGNKEFYRYK